MHRQIFRLVPLLVCICLAGPVLAVEKDWITLENCQLIENASNDGDSFHVRANGTEYLVRLYLVDAPETESRDAKRLIEQAQYFGISVPQVIEIGAKAKIFVETKLSEPFTVITRMAAGLGGSKIERIYSFVQCKDGDLGELLVANGLARVHGKAAARPGMKSGKEESDKLKDLEQQAKQVKRGGWNLNVGKDAIAAATPAPVQSLPKPATPAPSAPPKTVGGQSIIAGKTESVATGKLDINTASKEELEKIPGVGPGICERIIAARPFRSADDLKNVKGIGKGKRYHEIRSYFQ